MHHGVHSAPCRVTTERMGVNPRETEMANSYSKRSQSGACMEVLNFLREEPMMAWFAFLALLVTIVPAVAVLWRRVFRRGQAVVAKQPVHETKPARFGNQTELIILLVGLLLLLLVIG